MDYKDLQVFAGESVVLCLMILAFTLAFDRISVPRGIRFALLSILSIAEDVKHGRMDKLFCIISIISSLSD